MAGCGPRHGALRAVRDPDAVKGGAFDSPRTACRTEARDAFRPAGQGFPNVTFRVVREGRE